MVQYSNNAGSSLEDAIVITGASNHKEGVDAEYKYLTMKFPGYRLNRQRLVEQKGKFFDAMEITLADGTSKIIFFDITESYKMLMGELK